MSEEAARLWGVIGTWFSGIGSMLAVIVSLYLARRQDRVNLTVSAGIRQLVTPGERGAPPKFVAIRVVNRGYRRVTVSYELRVISSPLWVEATSGSLYRV